VMKAEATATKVAAVKATTVRVTVHATNNF
jgi:hypothetical protein